MSGRAAGTIVLGVILAGSPLIAAGPPPAAGAARIFATPEDAVRALVETVKKGDLPGLVALFGAEGQDLVDTSDPATGRRNRQVFVAAIAEGWRLADAGAGRKELVLGNEAWPFPVPLVRGPAGWSFDAAAGKDEVLSRRIGRNELAVMQVLRSYVEAQKAYATVGHDGKRAGLYARRFGFGHPMSPDFPSESPGILWDPARQTESALASMSMGYQVAVTPLQMAAAVSSVANGGELLQPRVVRAVTRDGIRKPVPRKVVAHAIDGSTAAEVTAIMEAVVERGTGRSAQIDGYTIAGKTGTAQKVENGRYSNTDYNVSFVGFVPSRKPVFTIVVVVDSPHKVPPYGATVSAPIFKRIAAAALQQYGVPPSINPARPVLAVRDADDEHEGSFDSAQGRPTSTAGVTPNIVRVDGEASGFPDLRGLSAREALHVLAGLGMTARLNGAGIVVRQAPDPGEPVDKGTGATLWLERQLAATP